MPTDTPTKQLAYSNLYWQLITKCSTNTAIAAAYATPIDHTHFCLGVTFWSALCSLVEKQFVTESCSFHAVNLADLIVGVTVPGVLLFIIVPIFIVVICVYCVWCEAGAAASSTTRSRGRGPHVSTVAAATPTIVTTTTTPSAPPSGAMYPPPPSYPATTDPSPQQGKAYYIPQQGGAYPPQQGVAYPPQQGGAYPPQQGGAYPSAPPPYM